MFFVCGGGLVFVVFLTFRFRYQVGFGASGFCVGVFGLSASVFGVPELKVPSPEGYHREESKLEHPRP